MPRIPTGVSNKQYVEPRVRCSEIRAKERGYRRSELVTIAKISRDDNSVYVGIILMPQRVVSAGIINDWIRCMEETSITPERSSLSYKGS